MHLPGTSLRNIATVASSAGRPQRYALRVQTMSPLAGQTSKRRSNRNDTGSRVLGRDLRAHLAAQLISEN